MDAEKPPSAEEEKTPDAGPSRSKRIRKANTIYSGDDYDIPKSPASGPKATTPKAQTPKANPKFSTPKQPESKETQPSEKVEGAPQPNDSKNHIEAKDEKSAPKTSTGSVVLPRIKKPTAAGESSENSADKRDNQITAKGTTSSEKESIKSTLPSEKIKASGRKEDVEKAEESKKIEPASTTANASTDTSKSAPNATVDTPVTPKTPKSTKSKKKATSNADTERSPFGVIGGTQSTELLNYLSKKKEEIADALYKYEEDLKDLNSQLNSAIKASSSISHPVVPPQPVFPAFVPPNPASFVGIGGLGSPVAKGSIAPNYTMLSGTRTTSQFDPSVYNLNGGRASHLQQEAEDDLSDDSMDDDDEGSQTNDYKEYVSEMGKNILNPKGYTPEANAMKYDSHQPNVKTPSAMKLLESLPKKYRRNDGTEAYRFAKAVMKRLMNHKCAMPFNQPVDPVKLNLPDYFTLIKEPMDFSTINDKVNQNIYNTLDEFIHDVRLVFYNCESYNHPGSGIVKMSNTLKGLFESKLLNRPTDNRMISIESEDDIISRLYQPPPEPKPKHSQIKQYSERDKQKLADMINTLPEDGQREVLEILRSSITVGQEQEEIEIDIDVLDNAALTKLESFLRKFKRRQNTMNARKAQRAHQAMALAAGMGMPMPSE